MNPLSLILGFLPLIAFNVLAGRVAKQRNCLGSPYRPGRCAHQHCLSGKDCTASHAFPHKSTYAGRFDCFEPHMRPCAEKRAATPFHDRDDRQESDTVDAASEGAQMSVREGLRPIESGVHTDFRKAMSYADYLDLETLLAAQHPRSDPPHHDELLFIVQHQTTELWLKLILHELRATRDYLDADHVHHALKCLARIKHIQRTLIEQWSVLATLTPSEYAEFRGSLGTASGFQSAQYRAVEFILGNKNEQMLKVFASDEAGYAMLAELLDQPSVYDAFLRFLARRGLSVPSQVLQRDVRRPWVLQPSVIPVFQSIYDAVDRAYDLYEACESLVDVEDNFQVWRFRHLRTVQRTIGFKTGTGGSSGVRFLQKALDLTFFPELYAVRTEIGR
jgi:tryptophan 2,3-dioxygenase